MLALATAVAAGVVAAPVAAAGSFYDPPATLPARDGDVIRAEPADFYLDPLKLLKVDAEVNRVMYRTTDRDGSPIAVTGTVITPRGEWKGAGERPVIGYAVGTQGLGDHCAPSRQLAMGSEYEGPFLQGLLLRGYGVAITDYEGLGTPGVHTYVNRVVSGRAVLDSIRAAQRLPDADLPDNGPVAIAGYSQGGGAAAAAAELAADYAPELKLKGVAASAIPADLQKVGVNLDGGLYAAFLGYAAVGLSAGYGIDMDPFLNDRGRAVFAELEDHCTIQAVGRYAFTRSASLTADGEPLTDLLEDNPQFKAMVDEQLMGRVKPSVPVFVSHSRLDDVIPYGVGKKVVLDWCGKGARVKFDPNLAPTHVGGAVAAYPATFAWLEGRFAGLPAPNNCWAAPIL
ncbi:lipase family protein [Actinokineospora sp. UTMC 2448]|uniref:lipase family protein n=1 Tax=Actinokineospora sp. UTMC 2448 TaxID=2268449 RepID=UPI002164AE87|nr:lipase family protein [Actinokineospora sp. UTMC 2448]UVS81356.1 putative inactive lipase [Actinokineospora sp. UTMC 2448]